MKISLEELVLAYRKAKADLYYNKGGVLTRLVDYEQRLSDNLKELRDRLNSINSNNPQSYKWAVSTKFIGGFTYRPAGFLWEQFRVNAEQNGSAIFASPTDEWNAYCQSRIRTSKAGDTTGKTDANTRAETEFRLFEDLTIDFHVLSALWIERVGKHLDASLDDCAYGNRLRRTQSGKFNKYSLGSFRPYAQPYRAWHNNAVRTMKHALAEQKKIIAITADVASFYHRLDPAFLLCDSFFRKLNLSLTPEDLMLNDVFVKALCAWSKSTPLENGLPVGLPASSIIANVALVDFDKTLNAEIKPLYYGRYVDHIIIVIENHHGWTTKQDVWYWIAKHFDDRLVIGSSPNIASSPKDRQSTDVTIPSEHEAIPQEQTIDYIDKNLADSKIRFSQEKSVAICLEGESGLAMIGAMERQIRERSSEWRMLPMLPTSEADVAIELLSARERNGDLANSFRKTNNVSMKRAEFARKLRDYETFARELHPDAWSKQRRAFYRFAHQHILCLPNFIELYHYVFRIIRLAGVCGDYDDLITLCSRALELRDDVRNYCNIRVKSMSPSKSRRVQGDVMNRWSSIFEKELMESLVSVPLDAEIDRQVLKDLVCLINQSIMPLDGARTDLYEAEPDGAMENLREYWSEQFERFIEADLAYYRLADLLLPQPIKMLPAPDQLVRGDYQKTWGCVLMANLQSDIRNGVNDFLSLLVDDEAQTDDRRDTGDRPYTREEVSYILRRLFFAVRPLHPSELYMVVHNPFSLDTNAIIKNYIFASRGFVPNNTLPFMEEGDVIHIDQQSSRDRIRIAVANWQTPYECWKRAALRCPDLDVSRYNRLTDLVNSILSTPLDIDYVVFPENSLPPRRFMSISRRLHQRANISLIGGVEYIAAKDGRNVSSQAWCALLDESLGFPSSIFYRQEKQHPAQKEVKELLQLGDLKLETDLKWNDNTPPIISHRGFKFAMLICQDISDVRLRAKLIGKVDALFVLAWNQDINSFSSLVEAAALDIHTYVIQCNDRLYGDSRIRGPYKDSWRRDIVRVKGGDSDGFVTAQIDIEALRSFQSNHLSPEQPYKPVPGGFKICKSRRRLPR